MEAEFNFEVVEATRGRFVVRTNECPWQKRWNELGLDFDFCSAEHQGWVDGAVETLNPNFTFKPTKNMVRGDPYCEWAVEQKA